MRNDWDDTRDGYPSENLCSTIWDDYRPALSVPNEFSSMRPAQGMFGLNCEFIFSNDSIFYDPPKALMPQPSIIKPTLPGPVLVDPTDTAKPTADPGTVPKPTTPTPTNLPVLETDPPVESNGPSQSPTPGKDTSDTPSRSSQSPDPPAQPSQQPDPVTDTLGKPSDPPKPGTDEPNAPAGPSKLPSPDTGNSNVPEASPNRPPGATNTKSGSQNGNDPTQPTSGPAFTPTGASHDTQGGPVPTGVVITASNGEQITAIRTQSAGPVVVGGATLTQGQSTDIDGVGHIIVGSSGRSVGTTFHTFTTVGPAATRNVILTDGTGNEITVSQGPDAGDVVVGSSTVALGVLIMAGLGDVAANTQGPDRGPAGSTFVVAGTTFTAHATSTISLSPDVTLIPGGPAVSFDGQELSLAPSGSYIVVDGSTQRPSPVATPAPILEIGETTYTANSASGFVVDGATLTRGGSVVIDGTTVALAASGDYAVVNGVTQDLSAPVTAASPAPTLNIGGTTYTANQASGFVVDGTTLTRGGSVVVNGTTVALPTSGGYVVVNGVTQSLSAPTATKAPAPTLDIGGTTYTANSVSDFVIDGTTLMRGGSVVVDGTTVSLDASGAYVVVNGATQTLSVPATTTVSTTDRNADESATGSNSASASDAGSSSASSASAIATNSSWFKALVSLLGVWFSLSAYG